MPFDAPLRTPSDPAAALLARVAVLADLGRWRDALPVLHEALALDPSNPRALGQLARARLGTDDRGGALEAADQLVAVRPDDDWGHRLRSIALRRLGRQAEALAAAQEAVRLAPNNVGPYDVLLQVQLARRDHAGARATAERRLALAPDAAASHAGLATVALRTRRWADAEAHARAALAIDPAHDDALGALATAQLRQGRGRDAVETAFGAARLAPGDAARARFLTTAREYLAAGQGRRVGLTIVALVIVLVVVETTAKVGDDIAKNLMRACVLVALVGGQLWRASRLAPEVRAALRAERRLPMQQYRREVARILRALVMIAAVAFTIAVAVGDDGRPSTATWWAAYVVLMAAAAWIAARRWRGRKR